MLAPKSPPCKITLSYPNSFNRLCHKSLMNQRLQPGVSMRCFSQRMETPGCNLWFISDLWHSLLKELGYDKVILQGGDFGASISTAFALKHPENVLGLHLNYIPGSY